MSVLELTGPLSIHFPPLSIHTIWHLLYPTDSLFTVGDLQKKKHTTT